MEFVKPGFAVALMLDAAHGPYRGGTGRTFDWEVAVRVAEQTPTMLAGGLTPENVSEAIARVGPWAVDVSSGVERDGGRDHERVRDFVRVAKAAGAPA
jgi:phosphoribosylanthranilate isomerase